MSNRNNAPGTAIAVVKPGDRVNGGGNPKPGPKAKPAVEKLPEPQSLMVPAALLMAAVTCSAKKDAARTFLEGVYLHSKDGRARAVASDGARMFIGSFPLPKKDEGGTPDWLKDGIIISNDGLQKRVALMQGLEDADMIRITHAKGTPDVTLSDPAKHAVLRAIRVVGDFPDYDRLISAESFGVMDEETGLPLGQEWQAIGINSSYLKQCGDIANALEKGLPKEAKTKHGMIIRCFTSGSDKAPIVFSFETWPGALLLLLPMKVEARALVRETALLIAPAAKLTIAALRAHATRNRVWASETTDETAKAAFLAKAMEFDARVAIVLETVPGLPALAAPAAPAAEQPATEGDGKKPKAKAPRKPKAPRAAKPSTPAPAPPAAAPEPPEAPPAANDGMASQVAAE